MNIRCCDEMHDGNLFFEHKYPSIDIDRAIDRMNSFEEFEQFYTDDLMDENLLMGRYLDRLLERYNVSPNKAALDIGKTHSYVRKIIKGDELKILSFVNETGDMMADGKINAVVYLNDSKGKNYLIGKLFK